MAEMEEDIADQLPAEEDDDESERDEDEREFDWVVGEDDVDDVEEDDEEEDDPPLDSEAAGSLELDAPAERSGHIAVVDGNCMYVWGGYKVSQLCTQCRKPETFVYIVIYLYHIIMYLFDSTRIRCLMDLLTYTCPKMRFGYTTWRQEDGNFFALFLHAIFYIHKPKIY